ASKVPDHQERWESIAVAKRGQLVREVFGDFPALPRLEAKVGKVSTKEDIRTSAVILHPEPDMPVPALLQTRVKGKDPRPACVLLHLEGKSEALKHPLAGALLQRNWTVIAPDLRATGETRAASDGKGIAGAPDHNSTEHALWVGRPLLGQWV